MAADRFEVGKVYTYTDYGFTGFTTHWECVKRGAVMAVFVCKETGEKVKGKVRSFGKFGISDVNYEKVFLPREGSVCTLNEVA